MGIFLGWTDFRNEEGEYDLGLNTDSNGNKQYLIQFMDDHGKLMNPKPVEQSKFQPHIHHKDYAKEKEFWEFYPMYLMFKNRYGKSNWATATWELGGKNPNRAAIEDKIYDRCGILLADLLIKAEDEEVQRKKVRKLIRLQGATLVKEEREKEERKKLYKSELSQSWYFRFNEKIKFPGTTACTKTEVEEAKATHERKLLDNLQMFANGNENAEVDKTTIKEQCDAWKNNDIQVDVGTTDNGTVVGCSIHALL